MWRETGEETKPSIPPIHFASPSAPSFEPSSTPRPISHEIRCSDFAWPLSAAVSQEMEEEKGHHILHPWVKR